MGTNDDEGPKAPGATEHLCTWVHHLQFEDVPAQVRTRAKHLILDGLACAIIGAHLPWSEQAVSSMQAFEPNGDVTIFGHQYKLGPLAAALLNGAFIQACELDDYHHEAPLHSESVIIPTLFAAAESQGRAQPSPPITGSMFLLASIVGFEVGPRAGRALYGTELLSMGWHCGTVFGHPASAAAASKLFALSASQIEDAIGIACTQACGLMSAQYEGMIKRMQHGFAARNGLLGAFLAKGGYGGIRKVFERPYGGFLAMFSKGNSRTPAYMVDEITKGLGTTWDTAEVRIKTHACVGGAYGLIECIEKMQKEKPEELKDLGAIKGIKLELSKPLIGHCGWTATRPVNATGAQMNATYIAAVQLVDREVLLEQFEESKLDRREVWELVEKTVCVHNKRFDRLTYEMGAVVTIEFKDDRRSLQKVVDKPRGVDPPTSNEEIVEKYRRLTAKLLPRDRQMAIEETVLGLEKFDSITTLTSLLSRPFKLDLFVGSKI